MPCLLPLIERDLAERAVDRVPVARTRKASVLELAWMPPIESWWRVPRLRVDNTSQRIGLDHVWLLGVGLSPLPQRCQCGIKRVRPRPGDEFGLWRSASAGWRLGRCGTEAAKGRVLGLLTWAEGCVANGAVHLIAAVVKLRVELPRCRGGGGCRRCRCGRGGPGGPVFRGRHLGSACLGDADPGSGGDAPACRGERHRYGRVRQHDHPHAVV